MGLTLQEISADVRVWHRYASEVKVDLWSTAFRHRQGGWVIVDPTGSPDAIELPGAVEAIWLTNGNHWRSSEAWRHFHDCPVLAPAGASCELEGTPDHLWTSERLLEAEVERIELPGGPVGESAYWITELALLIIGDAMINLETHPFMPLPERYCQDAALLRRSLHRLAGLEPRVVTFAHGQPLVEKDCSRLLGLTDLQ